MHWILMILFVLRCTMGRKMQGVDLDEITEIVDYEYPMRNPTSMTEFYPDTDGIVTSSGRPVAKDEAPEGEFEIPLSEGDDQDAPELKSITKMLFSNGDPEADRARLMRLYRGSPLDPIGLYARVGDKIIVTVKVRGFSGQNPRVALQVGTPIRNIVDYYFVKEGYNEIMIKNDGPIYAVSEYELLVEITVSGATGEMPFFDLKTTKPQEFMKELQNNKNAKDVQLVSDKVMLTVSYNKAMNFLKNPAEVMKTLDRIIKIQEKVSGLVDDGEVLTSMCQTRGLSDLHRPDKHRQHFIESMYTERQSGLDLVYVNNDEFTVLFGDDTYKIVENILKIHEMPIKSMMHIVHATAWNQMIAEAADYPEVFERAVIKDFDGEYSIYDNDRSAMKEHLNLGYQGQRNFVKLDLKHLMFIKLIDIFGEKLYPTLHQFYREHASTFSAMQGHNIRTVRDGEVLVMQRLQFFILSVCTITGWDLTEYFEAWGIPISAQTKIKLGHFPKLINCNIDPGTSDSEITSCWAQDPNVWLPMKTMKSMRVVKGVSIKVFLTNYMSRILDDYKLILKVNDVEISTMSRNRAKNSKLDTSLCVWETKRSISENDVITVEVKSESTGNVAKIHRKTVEATQVSNLLNDFIDKSEVIDKVANQSVLNELKTTVDKWNKEMPGCKETNVKFQMVQTIFLETLISNFRFSEDKLLVQFEDNRFKKYDRICVKGDDDKVLAEMVKGRRYLFFNQFLNCLMVKEPSLHKQKSYKVDVDIAGITYTILNIGKTVLNVIKGFDERKDPTPQKPLDNVFNVLINNNNHPSTYTDTLLKIYNEEEKRILKDLVASVSLTSMEIKIQFTSERFRDYVVIVWENKNYLAKVDHGVPSNGILMGLTFILKPIYAPDSLYTVGVNHLSGLYVVTSRKFPPKPSSQEEAPPGAPFLFRAPVYVTEPEPKSKSIWDSLMDLSYNVAKGAKTLAKDTLTGVVDVASSVVEGGLGILDKTKKVIFGRSGKNKNARSKTEKIKNKVTFGQSGKAKNARSKTEKIKNKVSLGRSKKDKIARSKTEKKKNKTVHPLKSIKTGTSKKKNNKNIVTIKSTKSKNKSKDITPLLSIKKGHNMKKKKNTKMPH